MTAHDDREILLAALSHIPPDIQHQDWMRVAAGLKYELGEDGFRIFDEWSRGAETYVAATAQSTWKSCGKPSGKPVRRGSIFEIAKRHGFDPGAHRSEPIGAAEQKRLNDERSAQAAQLAAQQERVSRQAAALAARVWNQASPARDDHPYLVRKGLGAVPSIRELHVSELRKAISYTPKANGTPLTGRILIALVGRDADASTLEFIDEEGRKSALSGGAKSGCWWSVAPLPETLTRVLIGEGVATVLSAYLATGTAAVAALSCGNLLNVARAMREANPDAEIVVLADLGRGEADAVRAAEAVGGAVARPDFGADPQEGQTDFDDLRQLRGLEAVRSCIEAPSVPPMSALVSRNPQSTESLKEGSPPSQKAAPTVVLSRASEITPEAITWLWPGYLPAGKLTILAGQPGCGKTTIALSLAAAVTTGGRWPDGSEYTKPGNVLVWTGEDGIADTLVPRLMAAGADLTRVWFAESVTDDEGRLKPFSPARDIPLLSERVAAMGDVRMVIVDPIISVVQGDGHKSIDVRLSLQPLLDLGAIHNCAIFGITHFSKGSKGASPLDRILGSQAFGAAARVILIAGKDDSSGRRVFAKSKANIAEEAGGFEYAIDIVDTDGMASSRIQWGEPLTGSAREILREIEADDTEADTEAAESQFERARCLIYELLRPFSSTPEIKRAAAAEGVSWRTMERAKEVEIKSGARIRAIKQGKEWGWIWDNFAANHPEEARDIGTPTPPESSPPNNQLRQVDGGVENQAQQGFQAKSANSAIDSESPRAHTRTRTHARAGVS
ncbi:AAA family ATPase [Burkholderia gladioli]|uniref:AAA family ATPase n=1 Tax=Burkholderia gladioli TaxID=28095 RepID=UPI001FC7C7E7|nr:AAA family ATPase [Burkholderia gladioli]